MLDVTVAVVCGGVLALSIYLYTKLRRPPGFPPGLPAYPLLGSLPCLDVSWNDNDAGIQFVMEIGRQAQRYGSMYSMAIGHNWVVFISDIELIKETMVQMGDDFAGRPYLGPIEKAWNPQNYQTVKIQGLITGDYDEQWKIQHKSALQILKQLGYGHNITEAHIHEETDIMIDNFKAMGKEPFSISDHIRNAVANVIINLLFGERFDYEDKEFQKLRHSLNLANEACLLTGTFRMVPGTFLLPSYRKSEKALFDSFRVVIDILYKKISEKSNDQSHDEPRNFIEGYLKERKKNPMLENKLNQIVMEMFCAGLETTSSALSWGILFMVTYPEIQKKVQDEMDYVVGRGRKPMLHDRASLPYTMATIQEVLRLATVLPLISRSTVRECQVGGYTLPKNTEVCIDIWSVLRDSRIWSDPLVLKPERFLDAGGQLQHRDEFIPFGLGRRSCLGEQLAKQELFIIFSNLLHSFTFTSPDGVMEPISKGVIGITHMPPDYSVRAVYRE